MVKKKEVEEEKKVFLGKVGTNLQVGIVGLPNVGKSTFFNFLTRCEVPAENFPFCTKDPNTAMVPVPDERFNWLVKLWKPKKNIPAILKITDIAGLVKGASEGKGLGNAFLSNIKAVDAIFHMVRSFKDDSITHVEGNIDPVRDMEIIRQELRLKDLSWIEGHRQSIEKIARGDKRKKLEVQVCDKAISNLKNNIDIRFVEWKNDEIEFINQWTLLTAKTVIYLVNLSEKDYVRKKNKYLGKIVQYVKEHSHNEMVIPFSASFESTLNMLDDKGREKYLKDNKTKSQYEKIVTSGFQMLNLIYYFTTGPDEVKCWPIRKGTKAPGAAGKIHTDFEKTFICCEIMKYDDLKELGSEQAVKNKGKNHQQGKNYVVEDGDIILFKAGAISGKKGKSKGKK